MSSPKRPADRSTIRSTSLRGAERVFDLIMMVLFGLLGLILIGVGLLLPERVLGVVGGLIVLSSVIPLWLGGRPSPRLRWYPIAAGLLALGLLIWVHPWTGW